MGMLIQMKNCRTDSNLIRCVEIWVAKSEWYIASLRVVEIPDNIDWEIDDYDGVETIREVHRSW